MKYIEIPNPVPLRRTMPDGTPIMYGMKMLNEQNVYGKPVWREKGKLEMFESIYKKFEDTSYAPGSIVSLSDEEFEVYAPLAIMKGQELAPDITYELMQVMKAIINATNSRPEVAKAETTEAQPEN